MIDVHVEWMEDMKRQSCEVEKLQTELSNKNSQVETAKTEMTTLENRLGQQVAAVEQLKNEKMMIS